MWESFDSVFRPNSPSLNFFFQYCNGFCCTLTWIGHRHTYVPSLLNPPLSPPYSSRLSQSTRSYIKLPQALLHMVIYMFLLWLHPFILSGVISPLISSSMLGTYWPGEFLFQYPIILPFHTVHGVLKARVLKWFAIPSPVDHILSEESLLQRSMQRNKGKQQNGKD